MKKLLTLSVLLFSLCVLPRVYGQISIDVESGVAFQANNEIRIFNNQGTLFDFKKDFEIQGPVIPVRVRIGYTFNEKTTCLPYGHHCRSIMKVRHQKPFSFKMPYLPKAVTSTVFTGLIVIA